MSANLFNKFSGGGSYTTSYNKIKTLTGDTPYSLIFDDKRHSIWTQGEEYGYNIPINITQQNLLGDDNFTYPLTGISVSSDENITTISYSVSELPTKKYVDDKIVEGFTANDALRYCGAYTASTTINSAGSFGTATDFTTGAVYKISNNGYFFGEAVSAGDMIISYNDSANSSSKNYWNVINQNIDLRTSTGEPKSNVTLSESYLNVLSGVKISADGTLSYSYNPINIDYKVKHESSDGKIYVSGKGSNNNDISNSLYNTNTYIENGNFYTSSSATIGNGLTVSSGGAAITGDTGITGNLSASGTTTSSGKLTVSSGGADITGNLTITGVTYANKGVERTSGGQWKLGYTNAVVKQNGRTGSSWNPVIAQKTPEGDWTFGNLGQEEQMRLIYFTDDQHENDNGTTPYNTPTYSIQFPLKTGTIALLSDNVASATTLQTARKINGTDFDGSAAITTAEWGTKRTVTIADNTNAHTQANTNINGGADFTLNLPATITASLVGNASTATTLQTARKINGTDFDGSAAITTTEWGTKRTVTIADNTNAHTQANTNINGGADFTLKLPATITASLVGDVTGNITGNADTVDNEHASAFVHVAGDTMTGTLTINNDLTVKGNTQLGDAATDTTTINGNTILNNNLMAYGNTTLGNESTDSITINGTTYINNKLYILNGTSGLSPSIQAGTGTNTNKVTITVGGETSSTPFTIPFATNADKLDDKDSTWFQQKVTAQGNANKPVYVSADGTFSTCNDYGGGTAVTLNGNSKAANTASIYAPESVGTNGQVLIANASGIPTWSAQSSIDAGKLGGTAKDGLLTEAYLSTNGNDVTYSIVVGGTTFSGSIIVPYATNADKLDDKDSTWFQQKVTAQGNANKPVYVSANGTFSTCNNYGGGTAVTLNGTSKAANTASIYAPDSAGTQGQVLIANASGVPTWSAQSSIDAGKLGGKAKDELLTGVSLWNSGNSLYMSATVGGITKEDYIEVAYAGSSNFAYLSYYAVKAGESDNAQNASNADYASNSDKVDGYHAGNSSGYVPISNGTKNTNLNADLLDGKHLNEVISGVSLWNSGNSLCMSVSYGGATAQDSVEVAYAGSSNFAYLSYYAVQSGESDNAQNASNADYADNSDKVDGYHISVGSTAGTNSSTIYFVI